MPRSKASSSPTSMEVDDPVSGLPYASVCLVCLDIDDVMSLKQIGYRGAQATGTARSEKASTSKNHGTDDKDATKVY